MNVLILDDDGNALDARGEIHDFGLILHSRSGARGGPDVRNTDYAPAFRLILKRIAGADLPITGIWVDSARVQDLPLADRLVLSSGELARDPEGSFSLASRRMGLVASARARSGGNRNKRLRIGVATPVSPVRLMSIIGARKAESLPVSDSRLPAATLEQVAADDIWHAIQELRSGAPHAFGSSTIYDLVTDEGDRLPPKAVFGLAATRALGFEVRPEHFSAGFSQPCFRILLQGGYSIVPKVALADRKIPPEERTWREGEKRLSLHARRERGSGLAAAKKADFRRRNGRLVCERCGLDPQDTYGSPHGEACIEVHHARTQVNEMDGPHETRLEDLQCLCANCHRYVHHALEQEI